MRPRSVVMAAAVALGPLALAVLGGACAAEANLIERGGECFLATDCAPGLVCVEQANKSRICTDDLSAVAGDPPPTGEDAGPADGAVAETGVDVVAPPVDAARDTGPVDTGTDTAQPPQDAAGD